MERQWFCYADNSPLVKVIQDKPNIKIVLGESIGEPGSDIY